MKILIADDEPVSRLRLEAFLRKWGYTVLTATDGAEALHQLEQPDSPKLVILDRMMPNIGGLEVCRTIRKGPPEPYLYVILLTSQGDQREMIEGFEAGADDYISKPFASEELKARVRTGERIVRLQEQLISAREQLRVEATHDSLTGLLNRAAFFESFQREIARAKRQGSSITLVMADLDHFKAINDRYGHPAGDVVLAETARRLRGCIRGSDAIGRYGGEEFVIAALGCNMGEAGALAERFRASICASPIEGPDGPIDVTMSLGVAGTLDMNQAGQLLYTADKALYAAKHSGRNKVVVEAF